jgi:hypothetical protein
MVLIGVINLAIGLYLYKTWPGDAPRTPPRRDAAPPAPDAGVDAATPR